MGDEYEVGEEGERGGRERRRVTRTNMLCRETEMYFTLQSWVCPFKQEELCGVTKGTISSYFDCYSWRKVFTHNSVLKHRDIILP